MESIRATAVGSRRRAALLHVLLALEPRTAPVQWMLHRGSLSHLRASPKYLHQWRVLLSGAIELNFLRTIPDCWPAIRFNEAG